MVAIAIIVKDKQVNMKVMISVDINKRLFNTFNMYLKVFLHENDPKKCVKNFVEKILGKVKKHKDKKKLKKEFQHL